MKLAFATADRPYHSSIFRPAKLNERGVLHHVLPLLFIVVFAVAGVGYLVYTHAATSTPEILSSVTAGGHWCINDPNNSTATNAPINSAICNGSVGQRWTFTNGLIKNTALASPRCLAFDTTRTATYPYVVANACNGAAAQQWSRVNTLGFLNTLDSKNKKTNMCLALLAGATAQPLRINGCLVNNNQKWTVTTYSTATTTPPPTTPPPTTPPPTTGSSGSMSIVSTLYADPSDKAWATIEKSAPTVKYAIVNICAPDGSGSGCGRPADEKDPSWVPAIAALKTAGITPLYYISTNYGAVSLATVESELQNAKTWYGITDPMFDTTSTSNAAYYSSLYTYSINTVGADAVMYNPGTTVPQSYMFGTKEIMQVFEGTAADFEKASFPSWMSGYSANQFAATISSGTATTVGNDVTAASKDHIGNFYEDDESEPPNYATLPAFWSTEVTDVSSVK